MAPSILAGQDRLPLNNGMELRLLSALEVLQARREAGELTQEDRERALCSNACLLARALEQEEEHKPVFSDGRAVLAGLTGYELTRGILCAMRRPRLPSVEELCARASRVAVLEGIVDPTNVGAIFRSAAALHMDAVLVTPTCCDPLSRRAVRVSMGTLFQIPWTFLGTDASQWPQPGLERLKELGFQTAAMALDSTALSIEDPRLRAAEKLAILLGTEGDGLAPRTIAQCDFTVCIPMARGVDSLNVAAASAVAFWELRAR